MRRSILLGISGGLALLACGTTAPPPPQPQLQLQPEPLPTLRTISDGHPDWVLPPVRSAVTAPATREVTTTKAPVVVDDGEGVYVGLRVESMTDNGPGYLQSGDVLHSGDRIALYVSVSAPAYVYVVLAAADGTYNMLFPAAGGATVMAPDGAHRVPSAGKWFRLDKDTGREDVFVYAAKTILSTEDVMGRARVDSEKARAARRSLASAAPVRSPRQQQHRRLDVGPAPGRRVGSSAGSAPATLGPEDRGLQIDETPTIADDHVVQRHFSIRHTD